MSKIEINIPKPCSENWNKMSPNEKGHFCGSCQKTVFDFTKLSDKAIVDKIRFENSLCGRFSIEQLNRELVVPKKKSAIWTASIAGILSFLSAANDKIQAQTNTEITQTIKDENFLVGDLAVAVNSKFIISGLVSNMRDGSPVFGVNVRNLSNSGIETSVQTNFDGKYKIIAAEDDILVFSCVGYRETKRIVQNSARIDVAINIDPDMILAGEVVVRKRTMLGRIFHSIGKTFK